MAERKKIEYVRYYIGGTAAPKLEPAAPVRREMPAVRRKAQRIPVAFDPVAIFGTTVALLMLMCVIFGFGQLNSMNDRIADAKSEISALKSDQYALEKQYNGEINLEEIRATANAMGLVPLSEVRHITVTVPEPEQVEELTWWQELWQDFRAMFE